MRKFLFSIVAISIVFSSCLYVLSKPETASAVDPSYPDQGCVNGVQNSNVYTWANQTPGMVFVPRFNWLNAVSVRIKGTNPTGTPRVEAQIWNWHSNPHQMIATHSVDLTDRVNENWEYITESSQDVDPGLEYAIILVPKNGSQVYWSGTTNTSCYAPGYAMIDGTRINSMDYGFATYGWYDPSNPNSDGTSPGSGTPSGGSSTSSSSGSTTAPAADPSGNNSAGSTGTSGSTGNTGSTGSASGSKKTTGSSGSSKSSFVPNISEILADYGKDKNSGGFLGLLANVFSSPIMMILWPLLSLLFWAGVIILIIVLVRRRRKKKEAASSATQTKPESENKKEPKEEEKK